MYYLTMIIPVFNSDDCLGDSINSVINQTIGFENIELIIVDDCSTDNTRDVIREYEKKYSNIKGIVNAEKLGLKFLPSLAADINSAKVWTIKNSRQVVRWAFEQENVSISDVFECDDKFIVAAAYNINKDEYQSINEVKEIIKSNLLKEKKGDFIIEKVGTKTMDNLIAEGMQTDTLTNITFEMQDLPKVGMEPKLFAAATSKKEVLVKGNSGVFIYKNLGSFEPNPNQSIAALTLVTKVLKSFNVGMSSFVLVPLIFLNIIHW